MRLSSLTALCLAVFVISNPVRGQVPEEAWGNTAIADEAPMWIAEDVAVNDGQLQHEYFSEMSLRRLQRHMHAVKSRNTEGCNLYYEIRSDDGQVKRGNPASMIAQSADAISGVITDLRQGFVYGEPASLVEVTVDPEVQGDSLPRLLLVVRVADIEVEGTHLCASLPTDVSVPEAGATAVLLLDKPLNEGRIVGHDVDGTPILRPLDNELLISGSLPKGYHQSEVKIESLRGLIRQQGQGQ